MYAIRTIQFTKAEVNEVFLLFALILILAWIGAFVVFHVAGFLIHLLLIFAIISVIVHFARGARAKA